MVKPYSARKAAVRNVLLPATLPKWHRIVIFGLFCHFSVKQIFTFPTHFEDSFCSIWAIFPFCALLAVFHTLNSRDFLRFSCCFIFSWVYDRERFRASFPHTFPQVAITRFRPQPHCAGIMDDKLPGRSTPFFVENPLLPNLVRYTFGYTFQGTRDPRSYFVPSLRSILCYFLCFNWT